MKIQGFPDSMQKFVLDFLLAPVHCNLIPRGGNPFLGNKTKTPESSVITDRKHPGSVEEMVFTSSTGTSWLNCELSESSEELKHMKQ